MVCGLLIELNSLVAELGPSRCGAQAYFPHGMWDLPRPGTEPVSSTLAGGLFTTEPPRKPLDYFLITTEVNVCKSLSHVRLFATLWTV